MLSCFVSLITVTTTLFFLHCFLMVLQWCLRFIFAKLQTHMELPSVQGIRASWALRTSTPLKSKSNICKMLFTLKRSAYMYNCDQNHSLFPPFIFVNAFDQSFWLCLLVKRFLFHSAKKNRTSIALQVLWVCVASRNCDPILVSPAIISRIYHFDRFVLSFLRPHKKPTTKWKIKTITEWLPDTDIYMNIRTNIVNANYNSGCTDWLHLNSVCALSTHSGVL